jgi:TonB family protein
MLRSRGPFFAGSAILHAGAIAALVLWSFWRIDKVSAKTVPVLFVPTLQPPPPPPPATPPAPVASARHRAVARATPAAAPAPAPVSAPSSASDPAPASDSGSDSGSGSDSDSGGGGDGPGTGPGTGETRKPVILEESVISAARIAGNRDITLPAATKQALLAQSRRETAALVLLCLDATGVPTRIEIARSTGFADADQKIRDEMSAWRYRPYQVNGAPVPVCTAIRLHYRIAE